jgi:hypothetical protein
MFSLIVSCTIYFPTAITTPLRSQSVLETSVRNASFAFPGICVCFLRSSDPRRAIFIVRTEAGRRSGEWDIDFSWDIYIVFLCFAILKKSSIFCHNIIFSFSRWSGKLKMNFVEETGSHFTFSRNHLFLSLSPRNILNGASSCFNEWPPGRICRKLEFVKQVHITFALTTNSK